MTPDIDLSARILTHEIIEQVSGLFYARVGDGAIELLQGRSGHTCDKEAYSEELAGEMSRALATLKSAGSEVYWGDWRGADGGSRPLYCGEWERLVSVRCRKLLHYEALLLMRESEHLVEFYRAAKDDTRSKAWVGMGSNTAGAQRLLGCGVSISLGTGGQLAYLSSIVTELNRLQPEVVYFGGGMAGFCAVVEYWRQHPKATCIHLGSALDPLFTGTSRGGQLRRSRAWELFRGLL